MLRRWVQRLSPQQELLLINAICFALPIFSSVLWALQRGKRAYVFDAGSGWFGLVYELSVMVLALGILQIRGWRLEDFRLRPSLPATAAGVLVFLGYWALWIVFALTMYFARVRLPGATEMRFSAPFPLLLAFCLVNPFFEELFVLGYNMKAMENAAPSLAITVSAFVRFLYHLYQGPVGATFMIVFGVAAAMIYRRWRTLWPLCVAHILLDLVGVFMKR